MVVPSCSVDARGSSTLRLSCTSARAPRLLVDAGAADVRLVPLSPDAGAPAGFRQDLDAGVEMVTLHF
jgi:hypothetical protein